MLQVSLKDRPGGEGTICFSFFCHRPTVARLISKSPTMPAWKKDFHVSPEMRLDTWTTSYCFLSVARGWPLKILWFTSYSTCGVQDLKMNEKQDCLPVTHSPDLKRTLLGTLPYCLYRSWTLCKVLFKCLVDCAEIFRTGPSERRLDPQQQSDMAPQHFVMKKDMVRTGRNLSAWRNSSTAQWCFLSDFSSQPPFMQKRLQC